MSGAPLLHQPDEVALAVADEGLPLVGAGGTEGVVGVAEDHVRLVLDHYMHPRTAASQKVVTSARASLEKLYAAPTAAPTL